MSSSVKCQRGKYSGVYVSEGSKRTLKLDYIPKGYGLIMGAISFGVVTVFPSSSIEFCAV